MTFRFENVGLGRVEGSFDSEPGWRTNTPYTFVFDSEEDARRQLPGLYDEVKRVNTTPAPRTPPAPSQDAERIIGVLAKHLADTFSSQRTIDGGVGIEWDDRSPSAQAAWRMVALEAIVEVRRLVPYHS